MGRRKKSSQQLKFEFMEHPPAGRKLLISQREQAEMIARLKIDYGNNPGGAENRKHEIQDRLNGGVRSENKRA